MAARHPLADARGAFWACVDRALPSGEGLTGETIHRPARRKKDELAGWYRNAGAFGFR